MSGTKCSPEKGQISDVRKKKRVLVFPCGSELGLDIWNCVRYSTYFSLIGMSSCDDHGRFVYDEYIGGAPFLDDEGFADYLKKVVSEKEIDAIYPATDMAILKIKELERELGCKVVSSPFETVRICTSKSLTYTSLAGTVRTPKIYEAYAIDSYPVFVKPDVGHSSIGARLIEDAGQLENAIATDDELLILENLPGEEYTIDCFTDDEGKLLFCRARGRNRISNGISVNTSYIEAGDLTEFASAINGALRFKGAWFAQVKRDAVGTLCLMEIASRFGGSSHLSMALGVNLPLLSLFCEFGYKVRIECNDIVPEMDRVLDSVFKSNIKYDKVYVDYDDCLILDKEFVNHELVGFLYKCRNEKKKLILLSKHDGDLIGELKEFRLDGLFDEVLHLNREDEKYKYIENKNSILIDDSFAERENVREKTGICVFGPEMIMTLL